MENNKGFIGTTVLAEVNKSKLFRETHNMFKCQVNFNEKASFAELLAWNWAVAKQMLYTYLTTGYVGDLISVIEEI